MLTTRRLIKSTFILLFVVSATFVSAQVDQSAELKVTINDVITFTLNDANPTLIFNEADDFINGATYTATNVGAITSSGAYSLTVKAKEKNLKDSSGNKIKAKSIAMQASDFYIGTTTKIDISKDKQHIISGAPAAISKSFDLTYSTSGTDTEFIGKPA